jgi:hypothetical protein
MEIQLRSGWEAYGSPGQGGRRAVPLAPRPGLAALAPHRHAGVLAQQRVGDAARLVGAAPRGSGAHPVRTGAKQCGGSVGSTCIGFGRTVAVYCRAAATFY